MGAEYFLNLIDQSIYRTTHEHLSDLKREIFTRSWDGLTYSQIAESLDYTEAYIKEEGANLFGQLKDLLGERVTKSNFRWAIERYYAESANGNGNGDRSTDEVNFIGRESAIAHLNQIVAQDAKVILIQGKGGQGKTTLARKFFKTQGFDVFLQLWMATETRNITLVESVVEEWLRRDFNEEPGRDLGINLERLKRKLRDETLRVGILIDNLETALDKDGKFIEQHRPYVELLRALSDPSVRSVTLITSRERPNESCLGMERYDLEGLDEDAWRQFFRNRGLNAESNAIAEMWQAYGGNPKAMKLFSGVIMQDSDGDVEAYWQENRHNLLLEPELKDLVASQFDRLRDADSGVYRLLYRLGCYRYQDVSHVSVEGLLCLLWDVPHEQRRVVIRALQNRSLLEVRKGKYWLHPVIRAEAISRLKESRDRELTHRQAALFWFNRFPVVTTVDEALSTLEAYYHYLEIDDYEQACNVLTTTKQNRWNDNLPVGWLFYRFGLLQQMIAAIIGIIDKVAPDERLGNLYILLGYMFRLMGDLHQSLECHTAAEQIAETLQHDKLKTSALFNQALCYRDLGELEQATALCEMVHERSLERTDNQQYRIYSLCCLAYLHSRMNQPLAALAFAQQAQYKLASTPLNSWGKGYSLLFLGSTYRNLSRLEQASEYYQATVSLAQENSFTQIYAKALHGIAQLHREYGEFEQAVENHQAAIALLDKIGARCYLAEVHTQLGITYQAMGQSASSNSHFQTALSLFTAIAAPNQAAIVHHYQLSANSN
jgi:tetratricopeptide (TPR) repeat protein